MLVASLWLAVVVALPAVAAWTISAVAMVLLALGLLAYGSARISVRDGVLRAGRAQIALEHLGAVTALDAEATRRTAGREADARAYLLLRPYLKRAVRVQIDRPGRPDAVLAGEHPPPRRAGRGAGGDQRLGAAG